MALPSKHLEKIVDQFHALPGIGRKTAIRLALNLLKRGPEDIRLFAEALNDLETHVKFCEKCHNISDGPICGICKNPKRDEGLICVVEDLQDLLAIENTHQYQGHYHLLGGIISPMDGIGPGDLHIDSLVARAQHAETREIILALPATMEGDTTNFFIHKRLQESPVTVSILARGVAVGNDLQYTDEVTLGRSIVNRTPYETLSKR